MTTKLQRMKSLVKFELDVSFKFPLLEMLFIFFIVITTVGVYGQSRTPALFIFPGYDVSESDVEWVIQIIEEIDILRVSAPLNIITLIVYCITPLLMSFQIAYNIEVNLFKRYISYPIGRRTLIVFRFIVIWFLFCASTTIGIITPLFFMGDLINLGVIIVLLSTFYSTSFFVVSASILIAVATRKFSYSVLGGLGLSSVLLIVSYFSSQSYLIRGICNPIFLALGFFTGVPFIGGFFGDILVTDVLYSIFFNLALGICVFIISLLIVERMDV